MSNPFRIFLLAGVGLLLALLVYYFVDRGPKAVNQGRLVTALVKSSAVKPADGAVAVPERIVRLRSDQVLATVNGLALKVRDVMPVGTNQPEVEMSVHDKDFLLKRAVDRELIFQAAKEQGLALNNAQYQQLANLYSMRNAVEPGGIDRFNSSEAQRELEMKDAQAFMLQTALMAAQGASPDVTETQVAAYYHGHQSQFGGLPGDEAAHAQAWAMIDFEIRQQLAGATRASYNDKLAAYMNRMESSARIVMASLDQPPAIN